MIALIRDTIAALRASGVATILVEQRVDAALAIADRIAFLAGGAHRRDPAHRRPRPRRPAVPRLRGGVSDAHAPPRDRHA